MKDEWLKIRLSAEDNTRIMAKMDQLGIRNKSAYARKMLLDGYVVNVQISDMQTVIDLLHSCNEDLDRLADDAEAAGCADPEEIRQLSLQMQEIWTTMKKILEVASSIR